MRVLVGLFSILPSLGLSCLSVLEATNCLSGVVSGGRVFGNGIVKFRVMLL
jgi:hypothetical protein